LAGGSGGIPAGRVSPDLRRAERRLGLVGASPRACWSQGDARQL